MTDETNRDAIVMTDETKRDTNAKAEEQRRSSAKINGQNKASADYAEKKKKCEEKKNKINEGKDGDKKNLEELQKDFKNLACGQYFDEHADMHEAAHTNLAADYSAAVADHKNRVHKAISKDTTGVKDMLTIFSKTIEDKSNIAMKKVLLKSDKFIDIVVATLEEKMKKSGLPAILGIEVITSVIGIIIDIIPISGIGILATAIESVGNAAVTMISAVGPDSIIKTIGDNMLPIIEKIAVVFQGLVGSFSCCGGKHPDKISIPSSNKQTLITSFKELKKFIEKAGQQQMDAKVTKDALKNIDKALKFLGDKGDEGDEGNKGNEGEGGEEKKAGGGLRRKTRRRRHHKTKRKLKRFRKTRIKKKHRKKRTHKH